MLSITPIFQISSPIQSLSCGFAAIILIFSNLRSCLWVCATAWIVVSSCWRRVISFGFLISEVSIDGSQSWRPGKAIRKIIDIRKTLVLIVLSGLKGVVTLLRDLFFLAINLNFDNCNVFTNR